jgi:hypothetical protein
MVLNEGKCGFVKATLRSGLESSGIIVEGGGREEEGIDEALRYAVQQKVKCYAGLQAFIYRAQRALTWVSVVLGVCFSILLERGSIKIVHTTYDDVV